MPEQQRAVILGASGLIGSHLLRVGRERGREVVGTSFRQQVEGLAPLDVTDDAATTEFLRRERPGPIFLPAADPNVERCEVEPGKTRQVNVEPVEGVARLARELESVLIFYSSDYVFDGAAGPYREEDAPDPISEYGRQKLEAERILQSVLPGRHLILRVTVVYGWERQGKNFLTRLIRTLGEGRPMRAPVDQIGTPTLADDLAEASWSLAERGARGVYHVAGPDLIDRHAFATRAARTFGLDPELVEPVSTAELGQVAPRPLSAGMISAKAEAVLGRSLVGVDEGLQRIKEQCSI